MIQNVGALTKRNVMLFLRDRMAVFFAFLSSIIVVALYFLFIARAYSSSMDGAGIPFTDNAKYFAIYMQMMAGVLILNSVSLSVGVFTVIAKDFENRRTDSFLLTPIRVWELLASYFAAGVLVSFLLNLLVWGASAALIGALTGYWISAASFSAGIGVLFLASLVSASLMLFLTALVKSSTAISIFSSVAGTFLGFLCGIYMPYSALGKGAEMVGSAIPFTHLAIWMKQVVLADVFSQLDVPAAIESALMDDAFSAQNIGFIGADIPLSVMLVGTGTFSLVLLFAAWLILRKRIAQ